MLLAGGLNEAMDEQQQGVFLLCRAVAERARVDGTDDEQLRKRKRTAAFASCPPTLHCT